MSLDDDERARIQAALDQAGMGLQEEDVQEGLEAFYEACNEFAALLHKHLHLDAVAGGLGGIFSVWLFNEYPDIYCAFDPDWQEPEDTEEADDAWEPFPEPSPEHKLEGSDRWCPRCGAQFNDTEALCIYDATLLKKYT